MASALHLFFVFSRFFLYCVEMRFQQKKRVPEEDCAKSGLANQMTAFVCW